MSETLEQRTYLVPGMSCGHCRAAITAESRSLRAFRLWTSISKPSASPSRVPLDDDAAVRAAIDEAGYDVA